MVSRREIIRKDLIQIALVSKEDYHDLEVAKGANKILSAGGRVALGMGNTRIIKSLGNGVICKWGYVKS